MTPADYVNSVVGKPWVNRAEGPDAFDCFGLVLDSFRKLDKIELPLVPGYADFTVEVADAVEYQKTISQWEKVYPKDGAVMVCYQLRKPIHVGRCLVGGVVHALGNARGEGEVRFHSYWSLDKVFSTVEYYAFNPTLS